MAYSLLLLLDDIASVLDDVATMTKVAAKKTAGVLGDDLALNARQVTGVRPARELAVVWAVARGSAVNKLVLVPVALAIASIAPWAVTALLVVGGAYLCFEGAEKILHGLLQLHPPPATPAAGQARNPTPASDTGQEREAGPGNFAAESAKAAEGQARCHEIKTISLAAGHALAAGQAHDDPAAEEESARIFGAIRTDFILSAEIIVITLGVVSGRPLVTQVGVLAAISAAMTVGVYGLVALIVKLDDLGAVLAAGPFPVARKAGRLIIRAAPWLLRGLSIAGTSAMFLVGGGIIAHALPGVHHAVSQIAGPASGLKSPWTTIAALIVEGLVGLGVGLTLAGLSFPLRRLMRG